MIDFTILVQKWTEEGARAVWATLVCQCVKSQFPEAREIKPSQGDEGVDTFAGELTRTSWIWQSKFFWKEIGDSQKAQIRKSFKTALESEEIKNIKKWYLCIPKDLTIDENKWWENWKKTNEKKHKIKIILWDKSDFLKFYSNPILRNVFDLALNRPQDLSFEDFQNNAKKSYEHEIQSLESRESYSNAIFVLKLIAAEIKNHRAARTAFYNYELLKRKLQESLDEDEKKRIVALSETIFSMWEKEFNKLKPDEYGKDFYLKFVDLLKSEKPVLDKILKVHSLHNEGAIHSWADQCEAGWIEDFKIKVGSNNE